MTVKELMNELKWMLEHTECSEDTPVLLNLRVLTRVDYFYDYHETDEDWLLLYDDGKITIHSDDDIIFDE